MVSEFREGTQLLASGVERGRPESGGFRLMNFCVFK
jgi:hypothetical protein